MIPSLTRQALIPIVIDAAQGVRVIVVIERFRG
jgi:hypothetical protein